MVHETKGNRVVPPYGNFPQKIRTVSEICQGATVPIGNFPDHWEMEQKDTPIKPNWQKNAINLRPQKFMQMPMRMSALLPHWADFYVGCLIIRKSCSNTKHLDLEKIGD